MTSPLGRMKLGRAAQPTKGSIRILVGLTPGVGVMSRVGTQRRTVIVLKVSPETPALRRLGVFHPVHDRKFSLARFRELGLLDRCAEISVTAGDNTDFP